MDILTILDLPFHDYLSIYLVHLWFPSSEFSSFLDIALVHILLDLYFGIWFFGVLIKMVLCFKFQISLFAGI